MAIAWVTPTFSAGDFTGTLPGTWTVGAGNVATYRWRRIGKTMTVAFSITLTTVASGPTELHIAIPLGLAAKRVTSAAITVSDAGTPGAGYCTVLASGRTINCLRESEAAWSNAVASTSVQGEITFEVA